MHYGFHNVKRSGEAKNADEDAAASYPDHLKAIIEEASTSPSRSLTWVKQACSGSKCLKAYTHEKSDPGFKAFKDHFTLLLGADVTRDCKLKPVMVYQAYNPHALKGYDKGSLPVHWYTNSSGWMTGHTFQAYSKAALAHKLKEYCTSQGLPFHILMVLDNASTHPHVLQDLHSDIKSVFLPPNTTSLLQPMDQGAIQMFKTLPSGDAVCP